MPLRRSAVGGGAGRPRFADAALAVLVVAIVAVMVVPLPTWLLDVLLATNLAVSVAILLVTLYVGSALEVSTFPALLLITTLVRIALNVSSTRLILLRGDAGEVIRAFGEFVVSGNFVVGAVVFLILTIVQFVVVAKGSERVAEVGARFSLDALPGKQLAIDADLRSGIIDPDEARNRRHALERESHFYGAMDGAVKFIKGDVVASVLIAVVNLVGGVAIGIGQRGLTFDAAIRRYGLLTIGDGLVVQIPALLLATAAGILVTRVASEVPGSALGSELSAQLLAVPRALGVSGGLVLCLAVVPGLPTAPFLVIGALLLVAWNVRRKRATRIAADPFPEDGESGGPAFVPVVVPWSVSLGPRLAEAVGGAGGALPLIERVRHRVFRERGVPLPPCRITSDPSLPAWDVVLSVHEVPTRAVTLPEGADAAAFVEGEAVKIVLERAPDFLGIAETRALLDELERRSPATVRQIVPKIVSVPALAEVLRRLVEEGVGIRDLRSILEALARAPTSEQDSLALSEHVRSELRRSLTFDLTGGSAELAVVTLDPGVEETIRAAVSKTSAGSFLALSPAAARDVVLAVRRAVENGERTSGGAPVVLTRPDIRRFVRKLLETDLPSVRVVSFAELMPEVVLKPTGRVTLAGL